MTRRSYVTLAAPLDETADAVADHLVARGYTISVEPSDLAFPYAPTLRARRQNTVVLIEVASRYLFDRLERWARYGKSCTSDTRVVVAMPESTNRKASDDERCRSLGVGLYVVGANGVSEAIPPLDLGVNVALPDIKGVPKRMREVIGPAYDLFDKGQWREGFEEACQAVEREARRYLKDGVGRGRIVVLTSKGNPRQLSPQAIDRLTMGQLKDVFAAIQNQRQADAIIHGVLDRLNRDRIGVVHHKAKGRTESRLRKNVGQHMWTVDGALRALLGVK
jgi:hypothetical protein